MDSDMHSPDEFVYRPGFGRGLTVAVWVICGVTAVVTVVGEGFGAMLLSLPWLALVSGISWAIFWRPEIAVGPAGVRLVNVLRTIDLPWPSIMFVDTKWALSLGTRYGKYTAWAAPTSSRLSGKEISPDDLHGMPESTFGPGRTIRPGDSPHAPSGKVALAIRRRLQVLQEAGHLDDPQLEHTRAPVTWHWVSAAIGAGLLVLGLLTLTF